jgi:hypothetical protein
VENAEEDAIRAVLVALPITGFDNFPKLRLMANRFTLVESYDFWELVVVDGLPLSRGELVVVLGE